MSGVKTSSRTAAEVKTRGGAPRAKAPFERLAFIENAEVIGARWWQETLVTAADPITRRRAIRNILLWGGGIAATGGIIAALTSKERPTVSVAPVDPVLSNDALTAQREYGWDFGYPSERVMFPSESVTDVDGGTEWGKALETLATDVAPSRDVHAPFNVPTLFQSLASPTAERLRFMMKPIVTPAMVVAYGQGRAVLSLFEAVGVPSDTALIVDLPGPEAIAFAAAMAERFDPIMTFDNWPHPRGVVPSHQTLAAAIYHRPVFKGTREKRGAKTPPLFVLDRYRLAYYSDDSQQFDNRYLAKVPSPEAMRKLGVARILYIAPGVSVEGSRELDDLNDDFVAYAKAGLDVKVVTQADFQAADGAASPTAAEVARTTATSSTVTRTYYYGGHAHSHFWFWRSYGWYAPPARVMVSARPPALVSVSSSYRPRTRPTMFSSRTIGGVGGIGKQKPSGFGRVSYRKSGSGGHGGSGRVSVVSSRSGSWGRSGSSGWSGG
ncbi:MAG: hypothetical protein HYY84_09195 [Deltaproteobacteria bacterium]|nr:hypothetical protein [Deltaproteobacteria bacterium]